MVKKTKEVFDMLEAAEAYCEVMQEEGIPANIVEKKDKFVCEAPTWSVDVGTGRSFQKGAIVDDIYGGTFVIKDFTYDKDGNVFQVICKDLHNGEIVKYLPSDMARRFTYDKVKHHFHKDEIVTDMSAIMAERKKIANEGNWIPIVFTVLFFAVSLGAALLPSKMAEKMEGLYPAQEEQKEPSKDTQYTSVIHNMQKIESVDPATKMTRYQYILSIDNVNGSVTSFYVTESIYNSAMENGSVDITFNRNESQYIINDVTVLPVT